MILSNAFSINMLHQDDILVRFSRASTTDVAFSLAAIQEDETGEEIVNAIGHPDTDRVVRGLLKAVEPGLELPIGQRLNVMFAPDLDTSHQMIVAQYRGPRLPEGATELPEGATIEWWYVVAEAEDNW